MAGDKTSKDAQAKKQDPQVEPVQLPWRERLQELEVSAAPERPVQVVIMLESSTAYTNIINLFQEASKKNPDSGVKSVQYSDLRHSIENFPEDEIDSIFRERDYLILAYEEARDYLVQELNLPLELLANILKYYFLYQTHRDIVRTKLEIIQTQYEEVDFSSLFVPPVEVKKGKDKSQKGDKGKKAAKESNCPTGYPPNIRPPPRLETTTVEPKTLYFILTDFFQVNLPQTLVTLGVPLRSIVEVSRPNDVLKSPEEFRLRTASAMMNESFVCFYAPNRIASELEGKDMEIPGDPSEDEDKPKEVLIYEFWSKMYEILGGIVQIPELEGVFHSKYIPPLIRSYHLSKLDYPDTLTKLFANISDFIIKLQELNTTHENYLKRTRIKSLGQCPKVKKPSRMKHYTKKLDKVPPECFNTNIYLNYLLEEVCGKVKGDSPGENVPKTVVFESEPIKEVSKKPQKSRLPCSHQAHTFHGCIRYQLRKLFNDRKHINHENPEESKPENVTYFHPTINVEINTTPFVVHETNELEMSIRSYTELTQDLFDLNITFLQKNLIPLLWQRYKEQCEVEKVMYKYHLLTNSKKLAMGEEDFNDLIYTQLFKSMECKKIQTERTGDFSFQETFPPYTLQIPEVQTEDRRMRTAEKRGADCDFKEVLKTPVFLQEIERDLEHFECFDHLYVSLLDVLLLKFHQKVDGNGISQKLKVLPLRTPVCVRDFSKHVIHEEGRWVQEEERRKAKILAVEKELEEMETRQKYLDTWEKPGTGVYAINCINYIMPGSIKHDCLQYEMALREGAKKGADKKGKFAPDTQIGKPLKTETEQTNILLEKEKLVKKLQRLKEECYEFLAFDLGDRRIHYKECETRFQSSEGLTVQVDHSSWFHEEPNVTFSLSVTAKQNTLFLHPDATEQFTFHFHLSDGTIIAFSKPKQEDDRDGFLVNEVRKPLGEKKKPCKRNTAYQSPGKYYHIEERCFNKWEFVRLPYAVKKREFFVPSNILKELVEVQESLVSVHAKPEDCRLMNLRSCPVETMEEIYLTYKSSKTTLEEDRVSRLIEDKKEFLKKLKLSLEKKAPVFKVCSSKLHRHEYVRRALDYTEVDVGDVVMRVAFKPSFKTKKIFKVKRCYAIGKSAEDLPQPEPYQLKITLPSGLQLRSESGLFERAYHISQYCICKGPQCKSVDFEESRTILRNGNVVVKKLDGSVTVLCADSTVINFDVPFVNQFADIKAVPKLPKRKESDENPPRLQKMFKKTMRRMVSNIIYGPESRYHRSRRNFVRYMKKYLSPNEMYLVENDPRSTFHPQYVMITCDGRRLKILKGKVIEEKGVFIGKQSDLFNGESLFEREDGTKTIFYNDGMSIIEYPDGTRLKSWFDLEKETVSLDSSSSESEFEDEGSNQEIHRKVRIESVEKTSVTKVNSSNLLKTNSSSSAQPNLSDASLKTGKEYFNKIHNQSDWAVVNTFYQFEHPNYATVSYDTIYRQTYITLPGHVTVHSRNTGEFYLDVDKTPFAQIDTKTIRLEYGECRSCLKKTTLEIHIGYLYDNNPSAPLDEILLQCEDTSGKIFQVDYEGNCLRKFAKPEDQEFCPNHKSPLGQKLLVMHRDLSGILYWTNEAFEERMLEASNDYEQIKVYNLRGGRQGYEFRSCKDELFCNRYTTPYSQQRIQLTSYHPQKQVHERRLAYATRRVLTELADMKSSELVFDVLKPLSTLCVKNFQSGILTAPNVKMIVGSQWNEEPTLSVEEEAREVSNLYSKWQTKKAKCDELRNVIRSGVVANYFQSMSVEDFDRIISPGGTARDKVPGETTAILPVSSDVEMVDAATNTGDPTEKEVKSWRCQSDEELAKMRTELFEIAGASGTARVRQTKEFNSFRRQKPKVESPPPETTLPPVLDPEINIGNVYSSYMDASRSLTCLYGNRKPKRGKIPLSKNYSIVPCKGSKSKTVSPSLMAVAQEKLVMKHQLFPWDTEQQRSIADSSADFDTIDTEQTVKKEMAKKHASSMLVLGKTVTSYTNTALRAGKVKVDVKASTPSISDLSKVKRHRDISPSLRVVTSIAVAEKREEWNVGVQTTPQPDVEIQTPANLPPIPEALLHPESSHFEPGVNVESRETEPKSVLKDTRKLEIVEDEYIMGTKSLKQTSNRKDSVSSSDQKSVSIGEATVFDSRSTVSDEYSPIVKSTVPPRKGSKIKITVEDDEVLATDSQLETIISEIMKFTSMDMSPSLYVHIDSATLANMTSKKDEKSTAPCECSPNHEKKSIGGKVTSEGKMKRKPKPQREENPEVSHEKKRGNVDQKQDINKRRKGVQNQGGKQKEVGRKEFGIKRGCNKREVNQTEDYREREMSEITSESIGSFSSGTRSGSIFLIEGDVKLDRKIVPPKKVKSRSKEELTKNH